MLTSTVTKKIEVPNEEAYVTIRKLSHYMLSMAQNAKRDEALKMMKALEGVTLPTTATTAETNDPANTYDRSTVLKHGVTAWSYNDNPADSLDDLDEETAAWLFSEIMAFSLRSATDTKASASGSLPSMNQGADVGLTS